MYRGGVIRSSDEGAVMALERRDGIVRLYLSVNHIMGGTNRKKQSQLPAVPIPATNQVGVSLFNLRRLRLGCSEK